MHPRMFLDGFWRTDIKYQVFVAMPFGGGFDARFKQVYQPAIETITVELPQQQSSESILRLTAHRVDNSKSGDSILTEIMDGIAHSFLILADLSEVGRWVDGDQAVFATPNGNVMYEVGLALASRQPPEVILVRDEKDKSRLLFDVSTIPCVPIDFVSTLTAIEKIQALLIDRIKEVDWRRSNQVARTLATLTPNEIKLIRMNKERDIVGWKDDNTVNFLVDNALPGLLSKGILSYHAIHEHEHVPLYIWTTFGNIIRNAMPVPRAIHNQDP